MAAISLRGYCRTLIVFIACKPAIRITKLTTIASTGRLMKRSVNDFMRAAVVAPLCRGVDTATERRGYKSYCAVELASRIDRFRIQLRLRREIVVDHHRHSIA